MTELDPFGGLLDGARARGAFALRMVMSPPWSLRVLAESPLTLLVAVTGHAWVIPDTGDPVRLAPGDVALTRGPDHYRVADDPGSPDDVVIHPGQQCRTPDGDCLAERMALGVRTWGNDPDGSTLVLVGAYESTGDSGTPLAGASGKIVGSSLEGSNADIADQFTKLIVTQQAYSANTKVITTAQTMSQEMMNMLR